MQFDTRIRVAILFLLSFLFGCTIQKIPTNFDSELRANAKLFLKEHGVEIDQRVKNDPLMLGITNEILSPYVRKNGRIIIKGRFYEIDPAYGAVTLMTLGFVGGVSDGFMKVSLLQKEEGCVDYVKRYNDQEAGWIMYPLAALPEWRFLERDGALERLGLITLINQMAEEPQRNVLGPCSIDFITHEPP